MSVDTPDPYINSALTSMVMAVDSLWSSPSICHSAIGYHNGQGGWRGAYSFVDIGRNDWIKSNAKEYMVKIKKRTDVYGLIRLRTVDTI